MSLAVERLEQSFEQVKPNADDFVASFYDNLMTMYPDAAPLFASTDMAAQKKKLLGSLVLVVENLRKPDALTDALKGLGARHVKYGALPEHYPLVGNALLKTFEDYLQADWTDETKQAWVDAYGVITELMLEGADYSAAEVALEEPKEEGGLAVELLEQSFEKVKPNADAFVGSFYDNLLTMYPDAAPLFSGTDMAGQKKKLLGSLVLVVENLRKPDVLTDALKGLGARHVKYGALPEHYPLVGNALLKTFEDYLQADWTDATKQAWVDAYGVITELMLEGADYSQAEVALEEPKEEGGLAVELLEQSFEKVKPNADAFVGSFYDNLMTMYPDAAPLFSGTDMASQKKKLLASLVLVVENLRKPDALTDALKGLGARHVKYGALPEHYPLVGNALLKTFEDYLKADWTAEVKQAWVDAYGAITELMLSGADYSEAAVALDSVQVIPEAPESPINLPMMGGAFLGIGAITLLLLFL